MTTSKQVGLLRFITAGSVDDGKSTLIGRLLYDSKAVLSDQLDALNRAKNKRTAGEDIDLSLLTDGLEAEREQGITIDVAYRYFATAKRKFIIADTPGHEQYTRNMVTGASTANAAIVLVDASKITIENKQAQLLTQTKRHSAVLKLLNTEHIIVAINKMDLLGYDEQLFKQIQTAYSELAVTLGIKQVHYVPISALRGDNIVHASDAMPWYQGPTLLSLLETLPVSESVAQQSSTLAFPVQWVARYDGASADHFRGYAGRIEAGSVKVGQLVKTLPAGKEAQVVEVLTPNGAVTEAYEGDNVCLRLNHDVDVSRGDMLVDAQSVRQGSKSIQADLCWFDDEPLNSARKYVLQHTTQRVFARVKTVHRVLDIHTLSQSTQRSEIVLNDLANLELSLQKPIMADLYDNNLALGSFILIDEATNHTVAAGMIRALA